MNFCCRYFYLTMAFMGFGHVHGAFIKALTTFFDVSVSNESYYYTYTYNGENKTERKKLLMVLKYHSMAHFFFTCYSVPLHAWDWFFFCTKTSNLGSQELKNPLRYKKKYFGILNILYFIWNKNIFACCTLYSMPVPLVTIWINSEQKITLFHSNCTHTKQFCWFQLNAWV